MEPHEEMLTLYASNLFLARENDAVTNLIETYCFKMGGSQLFEANMHRIMGLVL